MCSQSHFCHQIREKDFSREKQSYIPKNQKGICEKDKQRKLLCPKCASPLVPVNYEYNSGIIIDRCVSGCGIWLDSGELEALQIHREVSDDLAAKLQPQAQKKLEQVSSVLHATYAQKGKNFRDKIIDFLVDIL